MTKALIATILSLLVLTGCGDPSYRDDPPTYLKAYTVSLPDGGTVVCVRSQSGGVDCDWEGRTDG